MKRVLNTYCVIHLLTRNCPHVSQPQQRQLGQTWIIIGGNISHPQIVNSSNSFCVDDY